MEYWGIKGMFALKGDLKTFIKQHPVTNAFIAFCIVIALSITFLVGGYSNESIIMHGGLDKYLIEEGQIWRLITYAFGHMSLFHLLLNIPVFLILSHPLERYYGSKLYSLIFLLLILLSGVSIFYFYNGSYPLAGSSGVGYGLMGIYAFYLLKHSHKLSSYDKKLISGFLLIGILTTFSVPDISISGHFGGLVSGFIVALILYSLKENLKIKQFYVTPGN